MNRLLKTSDGRFWREAGGISYPCLLRYEGKFFEAKNEIDLRILFSLVTFWRSFNAVIERTDGT